MQLRFVPATAIAEDNAAITASQDTEHPISRSQRFNTTDHLYSEINEFILEGNIDHNKPPWMPYSYTLWQPLIVRSQKMTNSHILEMPSVLCDDLMLLHCSWKRLGKVPTYLVEPLVEDLKFTKAGRQLLSLLDGKQRWFIRLNQMSPKDSPLGGNQASTTIQDVITKLASSSRTYGCLQHAAQLERRPWDENRASVQLILNPWNDRMDAAREFRVFVPPPAARTHHPSRFSDCRISAISQYRWHKALQPTSGFTVERLKRCVELGAWETLFDIVRYEIPSFPLENKFMLLKYGFTFDVALQDDGSVQLVELNPFGAMSGCGACLFHWIHDAKMLYGLEKAEFAVVLEEDEELTEGDQSTRKDSGRAV